MEVNQINRDKFEKYMRSNLKTFLDAHVSEEERYLWQKIRESIMEKLRDNYQKTPEQYLTISIRR